MPPTPGFNFRVFFSPPAAASTAFDAGDALVTARGLAAAVPAAPVGFAEVSGLGAELEQEEFREGGRNIGPRRFPRWGRFPTLVLRRGVAADTFLWDWWTDVISHSYTLVPTTAPPRRNGVILLDDPAHRAVAGWFFASALPERLVASGLNARSSEIAIETLELSVEALLRLPAANLPTPS